MEHLLTTVQRHKLQYFGRDVRNQCTRMLEGRVHGNLGRENGIKINLGKGG